MTLQDRDENTTLYLTTLAVAFLSYQLIKKLYFHPLAKVPGPILAALTDYYVTYYDLGRNGKMVEQLWKLHRRYGPVVRIGPNKLHFSDLGSYDAIYKNQRFPKEDWFYDAFLQKRLTLFGCTDIAAAKERASIIRPLFSRKKVLHLEHIIQKEVDQFMISLAQHFALAPTPGLSQY